MPTQSHFNFFVVRNALAICLLLFAGLLSSSGQGVIFALSPPGTDRGIGLSPLNEIIPGNSLGSGGVLGNGIIFDPISRTLSFSFGYGSGAGFTDLTGPAFAFLLHGPSMPGETAPVFLDLSPYHTFYDDHARGGTIIGSLVMTPNQAQDLLAGHDYINIYTEANLGGELRGQLVAVPEPSTTQLLGLGVVLSLCLSFRRRVLK